MHWAATKSLESWRPTYPWEEGGKVSPTDGTYTICSGGRIDRGNIRSRSDSSCSVWADGLRDHSDCQNQGEGERDRGSHFDGRYHIPINKEYPRFTVTALAQPEEELASAPSVASAAILLRIPALNVTVTLNRRLFFFPLLTKNGVTGATA